MKTIQIVAVAAASAGFGNTVTRQTLLTKCKAMAKRLSESAVDQGIYRLKKKGLLKGTPTPGVYRVHLLPARVPNKVATPIPAICHPPTTQTTAPSTMPALSFTETGLTLKMGDMIITITKE